MSAKTKITKTAPSTQWWVHDATEDGPRRRTRLVRYFVEATSEWNAKGRLVERGIGVSCTNDCDWECSAEHVPYVYNLGDESFRRRLGRDDVPEKDAKRVVDLGGRYSAKDMTSNTHMTATVIKADGTVYEAWQDIEYVNEAVYGGENGYGVRVWERSVTNPFPVSSAGWDKTGNQSAPAHGKSVLHGAGSSSAITTLGTGYVETMKGHGYWAAWFPTLAEAKAFRDSVHKWQKSLPKFNPKEHV